MPHESNVAHWKITSGAFNHKISQVPKAHSADSLVLFPFIRKVEKVLELNGTYELLCENSGAWYVKG